MAGKGHRRQGVSIALATLALLVFCLPKAEAQNKVRVPQITSFASIPWGATAEHIITEYGKPLVDSRRTLRTLGYSSERVLSEDSLTVFFVHPKKGFIKGAYSINFGMGDDCVRVFMKFKEAISQRYPNIKLKEHKWNKSSLEFCSGVTIGKARWSVFWDDPVSDASIYILLAQEYKQSIYIVYESTDWAEAQAKIQEAERRRRF